MCDRLNKAAVGSCRADTDREEKMKAQREDYNESALFLDSPVISTERLVLRPPHDDDVEELAELANNIRIARMLANMPHPYTREDARQFVEKSKLNSGRACVYAITEAETGRLVGIGSLHEVKGDAEPHMGYWIGESYWGRGYATEAGRALADLYFKVTNRPVLLASVRSNNEASKKVLKRCGGRHVWTGEAVHPLLGERQTLDHFEITRESWMGEIAA